MSKKQVIGLLGGSFNPPHAGHLEISKNFKEYLNLDELWWIITPRNPLKDKNIYEALGSRLVKSRDITKSESYIKIKDLENDNITNYSIDLIKKLQATYPNTHFIWLIGADNVTNFDQWHQWQNILEIIPVAVINRIHQVKKEDIFSSNFVNYMADKYYSINEFKQRIQDGMKSGWCFVDKNTPDISSTDIRKFSSK